MSIKRSIKGSVTGGGGEGTIAELAGAKSTVTQILGADDTPEVILFAQDQVTSTNITILTNNQFNFAAAGLYVIRCNLEVTRQLAAGFARWYAFWEIDTGGGFTTAPISTTMESMSSNDSAEIHPVTKAVLYLDVTVPNTKLRLSHQTDASIRDVGIEAAPSGVGVPGDVPSIIISVAKVN